MYAALPTHNQSLLTESTVLEWFRPDPLSQRENTQTGFQTVALIFEIHILIFLTTPRALSTT